MPGIELAAPEEQGFEAHPQIDREGAKDAKDTLLEDLCCGGFLVVSAFVYLRVLGACAVIFRCFHTPYGWRVSRDTAGGSATAM